MRMNKKEAIKNVTYIPGSEAIVIKSMLCLRTTEHYSPESTALPQDIYCAINKLYSGLFNEEVLLTSYGGQYEYNMIAESEVDGRTVSYICFINCIEDTDVVLVSHQIDFCHYIWIDGRYLGKSRRNNFIQIRLDKGIHCCCFIFGRTDVIPKLYLRLSRRIDELSPGYYSILQKNYTLIRDQTSLLDIRYTPYDRGIYSGIIYSFNQIEVDQRQAVNVEVFSLNSSDPIMSRTVKFCELFEIDMVCAESVSLHDSEELNLYKIRFEYTMCDDTGKESIRYIERFFAFDPVPRCREILNAEVERLLENESLSDNSKNAVKYKLSELSNIPDDFAGLPDKIGSLKLLINNLETDADFMNEICPGNNDIYYRSELDEKIYTYSVYLPKQYSADKKYPLILNHAAGQYSSPTELFDYNNYDLDAIFANIPERGVTLGSYVAEAAMNETLADIERRFEIDKTRISAIGFSSGAAASWLQASLTPERFAAIAPCAGYFAPELTSNLRELRILDIESDVDEKAILKVREHLDEFNSIKGYSLINTKTYPHILLGQLYLNRAILSELIEKSIDYFPCEINYKAIHNRHLRAYWITVHSIRSANIPGHIRARIEAPESINVECSGVTGFTVSLPPQITGNTVSIEVNGDLLQWDRANGQSVSVICSDNGDVRFGEKDYVGFRIYRGLGLIDVYLKPVRILNLCGGSKSVSDSAEKFASPQMNTYDRKIYVNYPIYTTGNIESLGAEHCSIIIFDCCTNGGFGDYLRSMCEIGTDENGFKYLGRHYDGEYCVMQIVRHPIDPSCSILYINANSEGVYRKNFFTRDFILPVYGTFHKFLNNAALIFWNDRYYAIVDYGDEMQSIH